MECIVMSVRRGADWSIVIAQQILEGGGNQIGTSLIDAVDDIVVRLIWRGRLSSVGTPFESFAEFARSNRPRGLGVRDPDAFRLLRFALLERKHYGPLAELIELSVRGPGR